LVEEKGASKDKMVMIAFPADKRRNNAPHLHFSPWLDERSYALQQNSLAGGSQ
jgi:hypothetical protein